MLLGWTSRRGRALRLFFETRSACRSRLFRGPPAPVQASACGARVRSNSAPTPVRRREATPFLRSELEEDLRRCWPVLQHAAARCSRSCRTSFLSTGAAVTRRGYDAEGGSSRFPCWHLSQI